MMFGNKKNKKVSLLPYESKPIYGLFTDSPQEYGWELKKFNIPDLWQKSDGNDVVVGVIDTGCDLDHPDLQHNLIDGINFVNKNKKPEDDCGHGTHVSSTIGAINNGVGIVGIAPKTKIIPIKALDGGGSGSITNIIKSIEWAADHGGINFITMSLGAAQAVKELEDIITYANSKNCIVFCAAGNSGENSDIMYPAKYNNTISIGAIDENLERTNFTCSGEELDFLAPGHNILGCIPGGRYALMSGTSMSNPFAVGCASLLLSYNRKYHQYKLDNYQDYIDIFKQSAIDLSNSRYKKIRKYQGYGIINPEPLISK